MVKVCVYDFQRQEAFESWHNTYKQAKLFVDQFKDNKQIVIGSVDVVEVKS
jgi:hypothetical protein